MRGEVFIIRERCKGCGFCIEFCPSRVLAESGEFNSKGHRPPKICEEPPAKICAGCGFCTHICPDFAIYCRQR